MPYFSFNNIKIAGVASAVPTTVVKVDSFADQYGQETIDKFKESTGITQYHKTSKHQTASDLGFVAAEKILNEQNVERSTIGALVFVAHSTDYRRPATACVLHKRLNLSKDCAAFDIGLGCSAFVYGMQVVCSMMANSDMESALLIVGESLTKMVHPSDKSVTMLFGDGGAAILLEKTDEESQIKGMVKSDGNGYKAIIAPAGGFRNMDAPHDVFVWHDGNTRTLYNTIMSGDDVFGFTISDVPRTIKAFLEKTDTGVDDYDCLAFHQANQFISKMLCKKLKVDSDNSCVTGSWVIKEGVDFDISMRTMLILREIVFDMLDLDISYGDTRKTNKHMQRLYKMLDIEQIGETEDEYLYKSVKSKYMKGQEKIKKLIGLEG